MDKICVDKIYVCHWNKLTHRKEILGRCITDLKLVDKTEWVELYDKDSWCKQELMQKYPKLFGYNPKGRKINLSEISLALKHIHIIHEVITHKYSNVLVLEDDVVMVDGFIEKFNKYFSQLPSDYDLAWVGTCCELYSKDIEPGVNVYKHESSSRCTHCYIMSYTGAMKMVEQFGDINDAIDWYFNSLIINTPLNNFWFEPPLAYQNINFKTTIQGINEF